MRKARTIGVQWGIKSDYRGRKPKHSAVAFAIGKKSGQLHRTRKSAALPKRRRNK